MQGSHGGGRLDWTLVLEEGSMPLAVRSQGHGGGSCGARNGAGLSIQSRGPSRGRDPEKGGWRLC